MRVAILTGAGVSANAGIPTYRSGGSSWTDPDLERKSHANRFWNYLDELWDRHWGPLGVQMQNGEPTHTHKAIATFSERADVDVLVATQNIDDLHERGGSKNVVHLHGVMNARCMKCKSKDIGPWLDNGAPVCNNCGSAKTRPDVVLFGEELNPSIMNAVRGIFRSADYVLAVGTSLKVFPAANLIMDSIDKQHTIIINKDRTTFWGFASATYRADADDVIDDVLRGLE